MTTFKRESMLFGGWAEALIPKQTTNGVAKDSDAAFALKVSINGTRFIDLNKFRGVQFKGVQDFEIEWLSIWEGVVYVQAIDADSCVPQYESFSRMAIQRYVETWGPVNATRYLRAILGTKKARASFAGTVGALKNNNLISKRGNGWQLVHFMPYPYIVPLPQQGKETIKQVARTISGRNKIK